MSEFRPIYPAHAVERCTATIMFRPEVPEKIFLRLAEKASALLIEEGYQSAPAPSGFNIIPATGQVIPVVNGQRMFVAEHGQLQVLLARDMIAVTTTQYTRWAAFRSILARALEIVAGDYTDAVDIHAVKLEYQDRFMWDGTWSDFNPKLLMVDNDYVTASALASKRECHSHTGWFEYCPGYRRLTNVNVDVVGLPNPAIGGMPSIGILTLMQDEADAANIGIFQSLSSLERLDDIHLQLKAVLNRIISRKMATRIGLRISSGQQR